MESTVEKRLCLKCPKSRGQVLCSGCEQWFCLKHLLEHRQELTQHLDEIITEHDQLQLNLNTEMNEQEHSLFTRVARWESQSIERIKSVANEIRSELRAAFIQQKTNIRTCLRPITEEIQEYRQGESYMETDLKKWMNQVEQLRRQLDQLSMVEMSDDEADAASTHIKLIQLRILQPLKVHSSNNDNRRWSTNGRTVAGGQGRGNQLNQLLYPNSLDIDDDGTLVIADTDNHRIMRWKPTVEHGEIIAGGKGRGNRPDQLNLPLCVLIDRKTRRLIISEGGNQRVTEWSLEKDSNSIGQGKVIISNIYCLGLAMDDEGLLYASHFEEHAVRRYGPRDGKDGMIVAGGMGQGAALNQLNHPRNIFVDADRSIYVSDSWNHRVMKWSKNAKQGVIVAGGQGRGNSLGQLNSPSGILVDQTGSIYISDLGNDRLVCWLKGANQGKIIVGQNGPGSLNNQLSQPTSIIFDNQGNLYVTDQRNHQIQRFDIESNGF